MVVLTIRLCVVITGKSAFFWGVESIRLSCRRGRCFAAGPVGCQGSAYLYFFSQMRTICQDTGGFARSPYFHLFNKQSLFQGGVCCVCLFLGQDSVYVLTALPTELHRPGRRWDSNPRQINLHSAVAVGAFERGGRPAAFAARVGLRVGGMTRQLQDAGALRLLCIGQIPNLMIADCCVRLSAAWRGGWRRRSQDTFVPHLCTCRTCIWHKLFGVLNQCSCWMCLLFAHGGDKARVGFP